jgi:hypothetical protein
MYVGTREVDPGFCWGDPRARDYSEDLGFRREDNIQKDPQDVGWGGMDWIDLAEDRDRWQAFVNAVMKGIS